MWTMAPQRGSPQMVTAALRRVTLAVEASELPAPMPLSQAPRVGWGPRDGVGVPVRGRACGVWELVPIWAIR